MDQSEDHHKTAKHIPRSLSIATISSEQTVFSPHSLQSAAVTQTPLTGLSLARISPMSSKSFKALMLPPPQASATLKFDPTMPNLHILQDLLKNNLTRPNVPSSNYHPSQELLKDSTPLPSSTLPDSHPLHDLLKNLLPRPNLVADKQSSKLKATAAEFHPPRPLASVNPSQEFPQIHQRDTMDPRQDLVEHTTMLEQRIAMREQELSHTGKVKHRPGFANCECIECNLFRYFPIAMSTPYSQYQFAIDITQAQCACPIEFDAKAGSWQPRGNCVPCFKHTWKLRYGRLARDEPLGIGAPDPYDPRRTITTLKALLPQLSKTFLDPVVLRQWGDALPCTCQEWEDYMALHKLSFITLPCSCSTWGPHWQEMIKLQWDNYQPLLTMDMPWLREQLNRSPLPQKARAVSEKAHPHPQSTTGVKIFNGKDIDVAAATRPFPGKGLIESARSAEPRSAVLAMKTIWTPKTDKYGIVPFDKQPGDRSSSVQWPLVIRNMATPTVYGPTPELLYEGQQRCSTENGDFRRMLPAVGPRGFPSRQAGRTLVKPLRPLDFDQIWKPVTRGEPLLPDPDWPSQVVEPNWNEEYQPQRDHLAHQGILYHHNEPDETRGGSIYQAHEPFWDNVNATSDGPKVVDLRDELSVDHYTYNTKKKCHEFRGNWPVRAFVVASDKEGEDPWLRLSLCEEAEKELSRQGSIGDVFFGARAECPSLDAGLWNAINNPDDRDDGEPSVPGPEWYEAAKHARYTPMPSTSDEPATTVFTPEGFLHNLDPFYLDKDGRVRLTYPPHLVPDDTDTLSPEESVFLRCLRR
jgi:hypothetical protein